MNLADVVDLEVQFQRDAALVREGKGARLLERDRAIGAAVLPALDLAPSEARDRIDRDPALRRDLALRWIAELREAGTDLPGRRVLAGYRVTGFLLAVLGALAGAGAASAALAYDGRSPVNVFSFLGLFVVLQVALLLLMGALLAFGRATRGPGFAGALARLVRAVSRMRWIDRLMPGKSSASLARLGSLKSATAIYGTAEKWLLFAIVQRFAVAFNAGALLVAFLLVTFTDLAFGWSTTLRMDAQSLRSWLSAVAAPWGGESTGLLPSLETIRQSQWVRLHGEGFVGGRNLEEAVGWARDWWPFLLLSLAVWGLLPRIVALALGEYLWRRGLKRLAFDHAPLQRLWERLLPPRSSWEGPDPASVGAPPPAPPAKASRTSSPGPAPVADDRPRLVLWGSLAERDQRLVELVAGRAGREPAGAHKAGGASVRQDARVLKALRGDRVPRIFVVFEAGVQPSKEILHFLRQAREAAGARVPIEVLLVRDRGAGFDDSDRDEWNQWDRILQAEGDPRLLLGRVGEGG